MTIALPFWDRKQGEIKRRPPSNRSCSRRSKKTRLEIAGAVTRATKDLELARSEFSLYTPAFLDQLKTLVAQAEQSYAQSATSPAHLSRRQAHVISTHWPATTRRSATSPNNGPNSNRPSAFLSNFRPALNSLRKIIHDNHPRPASAAAAPIILTAFACVAEKRSRAEEANRRAAKHSENLVTLTEQNLRAG